MRQSKTTGSHFTPAFLHSHFLASFHVLVFFFPPLPLLAAFFAPAMLTLGMPRGDWLKGPVDFTGPKWPIRIRILLYVGNVSYKKLHFHRWNPDVLILSEMLQVEFLVDFVVLYVILASITCSHLATIGLTYAMLVELVENGQVGTQKWVAIGWQFLESFLLRHEDS